MGSKLAGKQRAVRVVVYRMEEEGFVQDSIYGGDRTVPVVLGGSVNSVQRMAENGANRNSKPRIEIDDKFAVRLLDSVREESDNPSERPGFFVYDENTQDLSKVYGDQALTLSTIKDLSLLWVSPFMTVEEAKDMEEYSFMVALRGFYRNEDPFKHTLRQKERKGAVIEGPEAASKGAVPAAKKKKNKQGNHKKRGNDTDDAVPTDTSDDDDDDASDPSFNESELENSLASEDEFTAKAQQKKQKKRVATQRRPSGGGGGPISPERMKAWEDAAIGSGTDSAAGDDSPDGRRKPGPKRNARFDRERSKNVELRKKLKQALAAIKDQQRHITELEKLHAGKAVATGMTKREKDDMIHRLRTNEKDRQYFKERYEESKKTIETLNKNVEFLKGCLNTIGNTKQISFQYATDHLRYMIRLLDRINDAFSHLCRAVVQPIAMATGHEVEADLRTTLLEHGIADPEDAAVAVRGRGRPRRQGGVSVLDYATVLSRNVINPGVLLTEGVGGIPQKFQVHMVMTFYFATHVWGIYQASKAHAWSDAHKALRQHLCRTFTEARVLEFENEMTLRYPELNPGEASLLQNLAGDAHADPKLNLTQMDHNRDLDLISHLLYGTKAAGAASSVGGASEACSFAEALGGGGGAAARSDAHPVDLANDPPPPAAPEAAVVDPALPPVPPPPPQTTQGIPDSVWIAHS